MNEAFEKYLDKEWPLWRQHVGSVRYHDLKKAFDAGWQVAWNYANEP